MLVRARTNTAMVLLLHELPEDALRSIFAHVELPHLLKLTCRAMRAAGPKRTGVGPRMIAKSVASMRLAHVMRFPLCWNAQFAVLLAEAGNLQGFRWWRGVTPLPDRPNRGYIPANDTVLVAAARSGNLQLLQWIADPSTGLRDIGGAGMHVKLQENSPVVTKTAARNGHFHILKWIHNLGHGIDYHTVNMAAEWGDYDMFKWVLEYGGKEVSFASHTLSGAITFAARGSGMRPQGEHRKIIEHLLSRNATWPPSTFHESVATATVEVLKWMKRNGCGAGYPGMTLTMAARHNRCDVLEWLRNEPDWWHYRRCLEEKILYTAVHCGNLEAAKWLRAQGCSWSYDEVVLAAEVQRLHIFRWMAANGAPIYHHKVRLHRLRQALLETPAGPLVDALVPSAMWVHTLMRWRMVKLAVLKWCIAWYWARLAAR